jgi:DNA-binding CsgD family transcriptional regulator
MERALELEREIGGLPGRRSPRVWKAMQLFWMDEIDAARPLLRKEIERAIAEGQLTEWLHLIPMIINLEIRAGNWGLAERLVTEALPDARDVGISYVAQNLEVLPFVIGSLRGETDARTGLIGALEEARRSAHVQVAIAALVYLALFEAARSDASEAWRWLSEVAELGWPSETSDATRGVSQPRYFLDRGLAVELLVALGEGKQIDRYLDQLILISEYTGQWLAVATAARSRALVEASRGDFDLAIENFEHALEAHRPGENPFELARTELLFGATLRRAKRRGEARETLARALQRFESLGAAQWAERARSELERTGTGQRADGDGLTPTEQRVAELVATGKSNKEVAAALFMSVRTVEANLSKIFRKLGVNSRAELANHLRAGTDKTPENG